MPDRPFSTGGKYIKIPTGNGMELYFESRQVGLLFLSLVLYIFAAFVASDSIYLLSAGFLTAVVLGVALPFISLYGIQATYAMPQDLSQMQAASIRLHLRRTLPFGVLSALVPTRALRLSLTVVKRAPDGKPSSVVLKPDPCYVDKLIADEWFSFSHSGAKTRYLFYGISRNLYLFSFWYQLVVSHYLPQRSSRRGGFDHYYLSHHLCHDKQFPLQLEWYCFTHGSGYI
ncbi:MAG: hypothetical protein IPL73_28800 [Candidatus Obscuribacter sp.]|nr:hypothetical protein [Candidatus Obscuribacter sp.]